MKLHGWIRSHLADAREQWYAYLVIAIFVATYVGFVISTIDSIFTKHIRGERLEQVGTALVLLGALWTTLGVQLSPKERGKLEAMALVNPPALDVGEIIRMFKAASNFATSGSMMIILGTAMIMVKMFWFSAG